MDGSRKDKILWAELYEMYLGNKKNVTNGMKVASPRKVQSQTGN
jgi:hypothetical protein